MFRTILEASQSEKKNITLHLSGQPLSGVVVAITDEHVEMRSREFNRIVVRLAAIDAAALP